MPKLLSHPPAQAAFRRAVAAIEQTSACEVVVAVRRQSAAYIHANLIIAIMVAFASLAFGIYADAEFPHWVLLIEPFVLAAIAAGLVELTPIVKRWLSPRRLLRSSCQRRAMATFVERGVSNTVGRTGLLVYVSWLEHEVVIVPDLTVAAQIPADVLLRAERNMQAALGGGGELVASKLAELANDLRVIERSADDRNELPDDVVVRLGRVHHEGSE